MNFSLKNPVGDKTDGILSSKYADGVEPSENGVADHSGTLPCAHKSPQRDLNPHLRRERAVTCQLVDGVWGD